MPLSLVVIFLCLSGFVCSKVFFRGVVKSYFGVQKYDAETAGSVELFAEYAFLVKNGGCSVKKAHF